MTSVVNATGNQDIDGVLWGWKWDFTDISFSFPTSTAEYNFYAAINGFQAFESSVRDDKQGAVRTILTNVESFCNLTFTETAGVGAILRYAEATSINYTNDSSVAGHRGLHDIGTAEANPPELGYNGNPPFSPLYAQGDSWFNPDNYDNPRIGTFQYTAGIMHETGHNLGLKHGHNPQDGHGTTFPTLPTDHNTQEYSVMTYTDFVGDTDPLINARDMPTTYMQDDIAALQYMYGANYGNHNESTTYTWSPTTGQEFINGVAQTTPWENFVFMTVWDGGGNDTYDFSNYTTDLKVDLAPGGWTILDTSTNHLQRADLGNDSSGSGEDFARGNIANALVDPNNPTETASLIDNAIGGSGNDQIFGNDIDNDLKGGGGADQLYGFDGSDNLFGNEGNDSLKGGGGTDVLSGDNGDDTLKGGGGADSLFGGAGADTADYSDSDASVVVNLQNSSGVGGYANGDTYDSIENVIGSQFQDIIQGADATGNTLSGGDGNDVISGGGGNDSLLGGDGADTLRGQAGNDSLNGGNGGDDMVGATGDDSYFVDNVADAVTENANEGTDTVFATVDFILSANVENLTYTGPINTGFFGTGNTISNTILGGNGADTLNGGAGADILQGFAGDDNYYVDNVGDVVIEAANQGNDQILCLLTSYTLGANIEVLNYFGVPTADFTGIGNSLNNTIIGWNGNDYLDGGIGADILQGLSGNDTYIVDNVADTVVEVPGGGVDIILTTLASYTLGANVENLMFSGVGVFSGAGNSLDNTLTGSTANDILAGAGGNDTLQGGAGIDNMAGGTGNDSYFVDNASDAVAENANEGADTAYVVIDYALGANVENLVLQGNANLQGYGNAQANIVYGNSGNNLLNGGTGVDAMLGGAGDDSYFVDNAGDQVAENANGGNDTVYATADFALAANIETLILQGSGMQGYGNASANTLTGNSGNNLLDGGAGADSMAGGAGNDSYFVDNGGDVVTESATAGSDTVYASVDYTLTANVEVLMLQGGAVQGYGNALGNVIYGSTAANLLNGLGGTDGMYGGIGNDSYFVDNIGDVVVENANEGSDTVYSSVDYSLAANVETLVLQGSATQGYGNALNNSIYGNANSNLLNGGAGADGMIGGVGSDSYFVDNGGDVVVENANEGSDTVYSTVDYSLTANVETLVLQGSAVQGYGSTGANTIYGDSLDNLLNGLGGADAMLGGAGNDAYFVENVGDQVAENVNEGNDTVYASVDFALGANIENLVQQGSANLQGYGNAIANSIIGNSGDNLLNGGAAADTLTGNAGNDVFVFNSGQANGDVIVDFAGNGPNPGDSLLFVGFGTAAQGALFTQIGATNQWSIHSGLDAHNETITLGNNAPVHPSEYAFA